MTVGDINSKERGSGVRYNSGKTRYDLIPLSTLKPCADVFEFGMKKYSAWNWTKGMDWSIPYGSALRHLQAWYEGEDNDPESGLSHLGHVMCNLVMLSYYKEYYEEGDDRPKEYFEPATAFDQKERIKMYFDALTADTSGHDLIEASDYVFETDDDQKLKDDYEIKGSYNFDLENVSITNIKDIDE